MSQDASLDNLKRARELKESTLQNVSILQTTPASSNDQATTPSSEDLLITTLRAEGKSWAEVTARLNEHRIGNKEAPTWTVAAVYSRYILSISAPAVPTREVGFEPRDYAHLRNAGNWREGTSKAGNKRVKDFHNATELSANIRKPATVAGGDQGKSEQQVGMQGKGKGKAKARVKRKGKDEIRRKGAADEEVVKMDEIMIEVLMRAVAKVDRNFWSFVADEVEREAGKYLEPKDLEKVFHDV
ncbi:hypothetical protein OPT61_g5641 [Boeremia exigua]|uniref:Uncharacterized protein n=1 Tax=Boeremia exigua TaxID=749465 RepID=A0ACC2I9P9_9PLEO|nr:hypothetical protein OPT61_g5641 [Boeremia exigua]